MRKMIRFEIISLNEKDETKNSMGIGFSENSTNLFK